MVDASNSPSIAAEVSHKARAAAASQSVGVIIVNFFTAEYLRRCLLALAQQTHSADTILVINNGDRRGELDFVAADYPAVRVLDQQNIGFAAANNLAIAELENHRWIALLNPDAFPEPAWLEQLLLAAQNYPDIAVFSSQLLQAGNIQLLDGDGDAYHLSGLAWRHNHGRPLLRDPPIREIFSACAAAALYRRDALIDVRCFDNAYFCYFEDVDLGFRLLLRGYRCLHIPSAVVHHIGSGASNGEKNSDFALYYGHRNLVWTFVKNMPGYLFWILLPGHLLLNILEVIWFACGGRGKVICRAKVDAAMALPSIWAQRKVVQGRRTVTPSSILKLMSFWPLTLDR